ncbi:Folylpolyglutamate synthase [Frankliniella fusca]|uniref:Folylpolyglutamate synthase n=1 Tax=Frankliniella fusca TaxID=407009 RepID=A0AAE1HKD0_9NEOP|nr:Folylpolyglutamate synthase [Frankliniella fusca]
MIASFSLDLCNVLNIGDGGKDVNIQDMVLCGITPYDHMDILGSRFPMVKVNSMIPMHEYIVDWS